MKSFIISIFVVVLFSWLDFTKSVPVPGLNTRNPSQIQIYRERITSEIAAAVKTPNFLTGSDDDDVGMTPNPDQIRKTYDALNDQQNERVVVIKDTSSVGDSQRIFAKGFIRTGLFGFGFRYKNYPSGSA